MNVITKWMLAVLLLTFPFVISNMFVAAQSSPTGPFSLTMTPQNWDNASIALKETTPENGLIMQIAILNNGSLPQLIESITFHISTLYPQTQSPSKSVSTINNLVIPAMKSFLWWIAVLQPSGLTPYGSTPLGSYEVDVTYDISYAYSMSATYNQYSVNGLNGQPLEPYPFKFTVVTAEQLQQDIQSYNENNQNKRATNIYLFQNLNLIGISLFDITLVGIGGVGGGVVVSVLRFLWRKAKPLKKPPKTS